MDDGTLDHKRAIPAQPEDPRTLGHGPCGQSHKSEHSEQQLREGVANGTFLQLGNQSACYIKCTRCALRVGYWHRHEATGEYRALWCPSTVTAALLSLKEAGLWESGNHKDMEDFLKGAKLDATAARRRAKAAHSPIRVPPQRRTASTPPGTSTRPIGPESPLMMATPGHRRGAHHSNLESPMFGRSSSHPRLATISPTPSARSDSSWQTAAAATVDFPVEEDEDANVSATPAELQQEVRDLQRSNKRLQRAAQQQGPETPQFLPPQQPPLAQPAPPAQSVTTAAAAIPVPSDPPEARAPTGSPV